MERVSSDFTRQRTPTLVPLVGYRSACRLPWTPALRPGAIRVRNTAATGNQPRVGSIRCWGCGQWGTRCCAGRSSSSTPTCPDRARNQPDGDSEIPTAHPDPGGHPSPPLRSPRAEQLPRHLGPAGSHRRVGNPLRQRLPGTRRRPPPPARRCSPSSGSTASRPSPTPRTTSRPNVEADDQDSVAGEPVSLLRDHRPRQFRGTGRGQPVPRSPWTRFRLDPPIATADHFSPR